MNAPKTRSEILKVWHAVDKSFIEKVMYCAGWTRRDITRELTCAWCGEKFEWAGESQNDTPNFCSSTHKVKAGEARHKRLRESQPAPTEAKPVKPVNATSDEVQVKDMVCTCRNHLGGKKQQYRDQQQAVTQLVRRHLRHGKHTIYKCPTSEVWHIASEKLAIA